MKEYGLASRELDTTKIIHRIYLKGKSNYQVGSRLVVIPQDLLDLIDKSSIYKPKERFVDMKEVVHFFREVGPRKMEFATLSEDNLYPSPDSFYAIHFKDKPDCPTQYGIGFTLKSARSNRKVLLSKRSIDFIKSQRDFHREHKIYGAVGLLSKDFKLVEYPFLFPFYNSKLKKWLRQDDFLEGFNRILKLTAKEFNLVLKEKYTMHDFRRTVNLWLHQNGYSDNEAAYWLGHDVETNKNNYLALSDELAIEEGKVFEKARKLFNFGKPNLQIVDKSWVQAGCSQNNP